MAEMTETFSAPLTFNWTLSYRCNFSCEHCYSRDEECPELPTEEIFRIVREKAQPADSVVHGAMEIDIPRQHPRLEVLCATLYLKNVHGIETGLDLSNDQIVERVFGKPVAG